MARKKKIKKIKKTKKMNRAKKNKEKIAVKKSITRSTHKSNIFKTKL